MKNQIVNLNISNFKSIREAKLECGRINLFVGKPNTGKSNLLEAISLLGFHFSKCEKFMGDFIRYKELHELFYWSNIKDAEIEIKSESNATEASAKISYDLEENLFRYLFEEKDVKSFKDLDINKPHNILRKNFATITPGGQVLNPQASFGSPVKKYSFKGSVDISDNKANFLTPPFGNNLVSILLTTPKLKQEIPRLFEEYQLKFVVDQENRTFQIQRQEKGVFFPLRYALIADTLQRIIFHYAALFSNKDSIILFEEPESHSFIPYVSDLAFKITQDVENQYFITTHSPHLFTKIVEEMPVEEVAIFITYFQNFETKFKKLSADDISELLNYGIDIFFNAKYFLNETVSENPS